MDAARLTPLPHATRRSRGRPSHDSAKTRTALLDAAEELFSSLGVEAVSIRSINATAGVSNPVVHYHFRSKDRLLEAVLRRRGDTVTQRTFELLQQLEAAGRQPTAQEVVKAIATPYVELLERDSVGGLRWTRLIGRLEVAQDPRLLSLSRWYGIYERFLQFAYWAFPDVPRPLCETAWRMGFKILMLMLGDSTPRLPQAADDRPMQVPQTSIDTLVQFVASGVAVVMHGRGDHTQPR